MSETLAVEALNCGISVFFGLEERYVEACLVGTRATGIRTQRVMEQQSLAILRDGYLSCRAKALPEARPPFVWVLVKVPSRQERRSCMKRQCQDGSTIIFTNARHQELRPQQLNLQFSPTDSAFSHHQRAAFRAPGWFIFRTWASFSSPIAVHAVGQHTYSLEISGPSVPLCSGRRKHSWVSEKARELYAQFHIEIVQDLKGYKRHTFSGELYLAYYYDVDEEALFGTVPENEVDEGEDDADTEALLNQMDDVLHGMEDSEEGMDSISDTFEVLAKLMEEERKVPKFLLTKIVQMAKVIHFSTPKAELLKTLAKENNIEYKERV
ncbi:hypothetical protein BT69DRAFT_1291659 [Atractiella rhizophila]|nr:hypothetical protein BT69DRAFT_1291659 [Atractiella rhizophila]